jgi:hypothetical protein
VPAQAIWSLPAQPAYRDNAEALEHGRLPRCGLPQDRAYRKNAGALGGRDVGPRHRHNPSRPVTTSRARRGQPPSEQLAEAVLPRAWVEYRSARRDGHGGRSGAGHCFEHRRVGVLGTHELSAEVIQPAKQPNFGHLADVLGEAQSEPSRHWSPMPSASGDGSLGEIVDAVVSTRGESMVRKSAALPPVWLRGRQAHRTEPKRGTT